MDPLIQTLLPVATLVLGYLLNVWVGSIESKRDVTRRRIAEREKAYAQITAKLHELFEIYRIQTLRTTSQIAGTPLWGPPDENQIATKYDELETLVYSSSLYLKPSIIQGLVDLKLTDLRTRVQQGSQAENKVKHIQFLEKHADDMWLKAKKIISEMRKELGLEEYPDDLLKMWG